MDNRTINNNNIMANNTTENISNRDIVQSDALASALKHKRCGLGISMGVGKTRIAIQHLQKNFNPFIDCLLYTSPSPRD